MPKYSDDMTTLNTRQPKALKDQISGALKAGETLSDFLRAAIVRELKKRGVKAKLPEVQKGRPRDNTSDASKS